MIKYVEGAPPNLESGESEELRYKVRDVEEIVQRVERNEQEDTPERQASRTVYPLLIEVVAKRPEVNFCEALSLATKNLPKQALKGLPTKRSLLIEFKKQPPADNVARAWLAKNLVTKRVRSESGVLVVTVLTSPYPSVIPEDEAEGDSKTTECANKEQKKPERGVFSCKYDCFYCPNQPGMPRSYLRDEPAVLRANQNGFDPVLQFTDRCATLLENGHVIDKCEVLILGGTWSSYPMEYREIFVRDVFFAANTFLKPDMKRKRLSLQEEITLNEKADCRIIGLTVETRPDCVTIEEVRHFRRIGSTRVQLGVQHTDDAILKGVNRGCTTADAIRAIHLLKSAGFKVDAHLMPNLPNSCPELDRLMLGRMATDPQLSVDQLKVYPTAIVPFTKIEKWFKEGRYKPYPLSDLLEVLIDFKSQVPPWIRLNRVVRDIPTTYQHASGVSPDSEVLLPTHWRTVVQQTMAARGLKCRCIRCREVGQNGNHRIEGEEPTLRVQEYEASYGGKEYFLSFENEKYIFGFCRLRISNDNDHTGVEIFPELENAAMVRELHVYGELVPRSMKRSNERQAQHGGFGRRLLAAAEDIVRERYPQCTKMTVISGVGVREFYEKLGWVRLEGNGHFLVKYLEPRDSMTQPKALLTSIDRQSVINYGVRIILSSMMIALVLRMSK